jgi:hypothetical protein
MTSTTFDKINTYQDARHAMREYNRVISEHATADDAFTAERAMLDAGHDAAAGRRAYFASLESNASQDTLTAARVAYDASKAASVAYRAEQAAAASLAAEDSDESYGDSDDNTPHAGVSDSVEHV